MLMRTTVHDFLATVIFQGIKTKKNLKPFKITNTGRTPVLGSPAPEINQFLQVFNSNLQSGYDSLIVLSVCLILFE